MNYVGGWGCICTIVSACPVAMLVAPSQMSAYLWGVSNLSPRAAPAVATTLTVLGCDPGRPDLMSVQIRTEWTECPRDKRDISTGQTEHINRMVAIRIWRCSAKFLSVCSTFGSSLFPMVVNIADCSRKLGSGAISLKRFRGVPLPRIWQLSHWPQVFVSLHNVLQDSPLYMLPISPIYPPTQDHQTNVNFPWELFLALSEMDFIWPRLSEKRPFLRDCTQNWLTFQAYNVCLGSAAMIWAYLSANILFPSFWHICLRGVKINLTNVQIHNILWFFDAWKIPFPLV